MADLTDPLTISGGVGTLFGVGTLAWNVAKWALSRNLAHEEKRQAAVDEKLAAHDKALADIREERIDAKAEAKAMKTAIEQLSENLTKMEQRLEARIAETQTAMRQDITRAIDPEPVRRVYELEKTLHSLSDRLTTLEARRKR